MKSYVDEVDVCDIPKGEDETGGSAGWVLYREWLYQRKIGRKSESKVAKK